MNNKFLLFVVLLFPCILHAATYQDRDIIYTPGFDKGGNYTLDIKNCPAGYTYNSTTDKCEAPVNIQCPLNYTFNVSRQICTSCLETVICNTASYGYTFDISTGRCRRPFTGSCPGGTYEGGVCYGPTTLVCPAGGSFNNTTCICEANANFICPPGGSYNSITRKCEANPIQ